MNRKQVKPTIFKFQVKVNFADKAYKIMLDESASYIKNHPDSPVEKLRIAVENLLSDSFYFSRRNHIDDSNTSFLSNRYFDESCLCIHEINVSICLDKPSSKRTYFDQPVYRLRADSFS